MSEIRTEEAVAQSGIEADVTSEHQTANKWEFDCHVDGTGCHALEGGWTKLWKDCVNAAAAAAAANGGEPSPLRDVAVLACDPGTVNTKMLLAGWGPCGIETFEAIDGSVTSNTNQSREHQRETHDMEQALFNFVTDKKIDLIMPDINEQNISEQEKCYSTLKLEIIPHLLEPLFFLYPLFGSGLFFGVSRKMG